MQLRTPEINLYFLSKKKTIKKKKKIIISTCYLKSFISVFRWNSYKFSLYTHLEWINVSTDFKKIIAQVRILFNIYQNYIYIKKKVFVRNFILYHVTDEMLHPYDETNTKEGLQVVVELQIWHLFDFRNILMKTKAIICNFSNILSFVLIGLQLYSIWLCISLMFSQVPRALIGFYE